MIFIDQYKIINWTIYKIVSPSGRIYIGKSSNFPQRVGQYRRLQLKNQAVITRSIVKYGFDNHSFEVVETFNSNKDYAQGKEIFWIRSYMSNICKYPQWNGMNMTNGGDGALGHEWSKEAREKARSRKLGSKGSEYQKKRASEVHKDNKYNNGRKHTMESGVKKSEKLKGRIAPEQERRNKQKAQELRGKKVSIYNPHTNKKTEYSTLVNASKGEGIDKSTIQRILKRGILLYNKNTKYENYIFKYI